MKIQKLFFLLFLGVLIGFSSCKKDAPLPESATLIPTVNTKSTDIDYIENQMNWLKTNVIENKRFIQYYLFNFEKFFILNLNLFL